MNSFAKQLRKVPKSQTRAEVCIIPLALIGGYSLFTVSFRGGGFGVFNRFGQDSQSLRHRSTRTGGTIPANLIASSQSEAETRNHQNSYHKRPDVRKRQQNDPENRAHQ